jgi:tripartite-type tricarboxylate transporter receptor subunit TctC
MKSFIVAVLLMISSTIVLASQPLNIVVPSIPGGGADVHARLVSKHLIKYINTPVNVMNMQGAGGLTMSNWIYNVSDQQNTIGILSVNNNTITHGILKEENVKYDIQKFKWLLSLEDGDKNVFVLWANRTRGLDNITMLLKPDNIFVIGNQGPNNIQTYFISTVIGVKSKIIFGYKDIIKALEMNEIDARFGTIMSAESRYPQWLTGQDVIVPILQMGAPHRHPSIKNVPNIRELVKDDNDLKLITFYEKLVKLSRLVIAPPNMKSDRVEFIIDALMNMRQDKDFISDSDKLNLDFNFINQNETSILIQDILNTDPSIVRMFINK